MVLPKASHKFFILLFVSFCLNVAYSAPAPKVIFAVRPIELGPKKLNVWVADNDQKRTQGMMYKTNWPDNVHGMLFIFPKEGYRSFWMKNTLLPLSLAYFDEKGVLIEMADMDPPKSLAQLKVDRSASSKPAKYVLEVPKGWFKKAGVSSGAKLRLK